MNETTIVYQEVVNNVLMTIITLAVPVITSYLLKIFQVWMQNKFGDMNDKTSQKYLFEITNIIVQAVQCTAQTYVDALKKEGEFSKEAQTIAFEKTKDIVLSLLANDMKEFIERSYGDLDLWLNTKIEQMVRDTKYVSTAG